MSETKIYYTITPPKGLVSINFPELWRFRELLYIFVWRDIKVRYKQTMLGLAWAIFQPLVTMLIFTIFFGRLAKVPSDNVPYPIFVYVGLLFWNYYSVALTNASNCLVENESIIKKVYFPRLILPISTTITPMIDYVSALVILFGLMLYYHYTPHVLGIIVLPALLIIALLAASGLGLFLSAVNVRYRDVRYILPFFVQLLLFLTPVIYPISLIPERFKWLLYLNPMTGVIDLARSLLLGTTSVNWSFIVISVVASLLIFIFGLTYFRKTERFFADIL
jgi:lipopolysaccharide transport system permease protein